MYGVGKELQSSTKIGTLLVRADAGLDGHVVITLVCADAGLDGHVMMMLVCADAGLDGHVVMVVVDREAVDVQEKIVRSDGKVADPVVADERPTVGSVVWGTVAAQEPLQVWAESTGICRVKALRSSSAMPRKVLRHQLLVFDALILHLPTLGSLRSRKDCRDYGQQQDQEEC